MSDESLDKAREAKNKLLNEPKIKISSVGITKRRGVVGLKVNLREGGQSESLPKAVGGVPIFEVNTIKMNSLRPL